MGIPPENIIERLRDPHGPYDYVIYMGWRGDSQNNGYGANHKWVEYFKQNYGTEGLDFGGPWFYSHYFNKLYFKEKDYAFFMIKFGHHFNLRPWEI